MRPFPSWYTCRALLLGLGCAAMAILACSQVPLTGRSRLLLVDEATEIELGATTYADVLGEAKLSADQAAVKRITTIGMRIADVTDRPDFKWEFNLIDADTVHNAFALPGGKVAVYSGILELASSDAEVATVMAHEIAHAIARHGAERMSQMLMVQLGGMVLEEAIKKESEKTIEIARVAYGAGVGLAYILPYSRTHESEADYMGLIYMAQAGYDPRAALSFWRKMHERYAGQQPPEFLSTHPSSDRRIADLQKWMPEALRHYDAAR